MPSTSNPSHVPVAVIGLSCRFPGDATSPSKFWDLLKNGRDAYSSTTDRYNADAFYHPNASKRQNMLATKGGHFLKQDPYAFDAAFFNITAAEAISFDPKQRIAMEVVYEALENAGKTLPKVAGTQTACYIGSSMSDYRDAVVRDFGNSPKYHILGTCEEMISNRVSHFLDIHGPSATIHTACSSSLVATHLACQSLQSGESEMAIAGGVGMIISPDGNMHLNNLGFLNPEGHSRSFDENAGGYGRGEGCGILVLKRLDKALENGDCIRAIIRASGVNSDGWTQGVTMPSSEAQSALIKYVYESHGLDYGATQYVEAHGTGTKLGDPAEVGALHRTIGQDTTQSRKLWIGSVKPNIGHLEAAAGVAGIIKGVLSMEQGMLPPNIYFSKPNPAIPLDEWNMAVPTKLMPWPATQTGRRMSVSGFGMGGTNGHVVLDGYTPLKKITSTPQHTGKRLFLLSSQDQAGFKRIADSLVEHLDALGPAASTPEYLANFSHTLAIARSDLSWRASFVADTIFELRHKLSTEPGENAVRSSGNKPRIGFVFTGQGAQWARMGLELLERPVFKDSVNKSTEILKQLGCEWEPIKELSKAQDESRLGVPEVSQPICTVLQIALVEELKSWDISPLKVVGHSSGEIAAAYTIGALSHRDAIAAAFFRGKASSGLKHLKGGMMAAGCSREEAEALISETSLNGIATVACVNSPSSVTISGDVAALEGLQVVMEQKAVFNRRLKVDVAYHSTHMNAALTEYSSSIADIEALEPFDNHPVMISSVTNSEVDHELLGPYYWARNLISPVLFADAVKELVRPLDGDDQNTIDLLIELGPHSALGGPIEQILSHHGITNVSYNSVLTRGQNALDSILKLASDFFLQSVPFELQTANGDIDCRMLTNLPSYPWNHSKSFRADSRIHREHLEQKFPTRSLIGSPVPMMGENEYVWRNFIRLADEPWLRGHTVGSTVLFPGAGIVSIVLEASQQLIDAGKTIRGFRMRDVSLFAAMALPDDLATEVIIHIRPQLIATTGSTAPSCWWEWTVSSCVGTDQLRDNARGLVAIDYEEGRSEQVVLEDKAIVAAQVTDYHEIFGECSETYPKEQFYQHMTKASWSYGTLFQGVENCHPGYGKTTFDIRLVDIGETFSSGQLERPFLINAASLDAVFQSWLGSTYNNGEFEFDKPFVPTSIGELDISINIPADADYIMPGYCRSERYGFNELSADIVLFDTNLQDVFLSVKDFRTSELDMDAGRMDSDITRVDPADITSEVKWNFALAMLKPAEISEIISKVPSQNRLAELIRMTLHNKPAPTAIEIVSDVSRIAEAAMSNLSKSVILPSQIRYVVPNTKEGGERDLEAFWQFFAQDENGTPVPADKGPAELLVISEEARALDTLEHLAELAKPEAAIVAVNNAATITALIAAELEVVANIEGDASLALYNYKKSQSNGTNGIHKHESIILKPVGIEALVQEFSTAMTESLENQGYSVTTQSWGSDVSAENVKGKTFIALLELEHPVLDNLSKEDFENLRTVVLNCERLLWVTRGDNPSFGMVDGFARCIMSEIASCKFQILHLSESSGLQHGSSLATRILKSDTDDNEYREVDGNLQVARIFKNYEENDSLRHHLEDATRVVTLAEQDDALRLTIGKPGLLDTLQLVTDERMLPPLQDHEVEVQVKATGLNFRDIMACMGLIPVRVLGQEASGIVLRTGSQATKFKPGDRVSTLTVGAHATKIRTDYRVMAKIPDSMTLEEAAAVGVVHTTAYYAFVTVAKLRKGQSVLIHAAAGGVGQAAIQLAKHLGLIVYVTVGTDEKRKLVMETYGIPEEHIFNSRDTSFAKGINRVTGGRGVDCVLNSLSGELLRASWGCLATFGHFVEIGLRDITNNMRLDMRPFRRSTSFTFINSHTLFLEDPAALGDMLSETFKLMSDGALYAPSPLNVYSIGQAGDAFRIMQQGKHSGKVVLSFSDDSQAPVLHKAKNSLKLDPNATYLFVGGLGGLGRSLAKEFVASGCRNIAFLSRSGDSSPQAKAIVDELAGQHVQVKAYRADIAEQSSFADAMKQCSQDLPPVKGVIQMAMVLRDIVFEKMSYEEWTVPIGPKVQGTWNLHKYFGQERPLDFMVICSSGSGIYGYPSQAQYAAGNTYQDAIAHYRRSQGLNAISVNLGIMRDVGVLAESGTTGNIKLWEEVLGIREPAFHALMKSLINQQQRSSKFYPSQVCTGLGTADIMATHGLARPEYFNDPRFGPLAITTVASAASANESGSAVPLAAKLSQATSKDEATEIIKDALVQKTAEILQMPASEVDPGRPLYRYGVDSLVALEVRNWITREMKANMALLEILAAVPIENFAAKIAEKSKLVTV